MSDKLIHTEISIKELQTLAGFIKTLHASGKIDTEQRRLFMHAIMAGDSQGNLWTIGTQTGKWYKQAGDKWLEGKPPEKLLLVVPEKDFKEAEIQLEELKFELEMKTFRDNRCPNCRAEIAVGDHFCTKCGTEISDIKQQKLLPVHQITKCPACGQIIEGSQNFCNKCGKKLN
jgi:DNA-directed RNA polymerase subunit RPC12/RpoP